MTLQDGSTFEIRETARIWADGRKTHAFDLHAGWRIIAVRLGDRTFRT